MMQFLSRFARARRGNLAARASLLILASLMLIPGSRPAQAAPPEVGVWLDHDGKGAIEIKPCGQTLCGNIVWLKNQLNDQGEPLFDRRNPDATKRNRPICGLPVIGNLRPTPDGWDEGWIYSPEEGSQYDLALKATTRDQLTVTGYKGVKLFSKTFVWTRAAASLEKCGNAPSQTKLPVPPAPKAAAPKTGTGTAAATKKPVVAPTAPKSADKSLAPAVSKKAAVAPDLKPAGPKPAAKPAAAKTAAKPGSPAPGPATAKAGAKPAPTKKADPAKAGPAKSAKATLPNAPAPAKAAKPASSLKNVDPKAAKAIADKKAAAAKKKSAEDAAASSAVE